MEEKRKIKEQKELTKEIKLEEKKLKESNKKSKQKVNINKKIQVSKNDLAIFDTLAEKILSKNSFRPYPDINDIPD